MVAQTQTSSSARPPPDVPNDPKLSTQTSQYLRNFALWCRHGFQDSLRNQEALPGIMLRGFDTQGGNPNVYMLEVDNAGIAYLAPMALGSGTMGAPVPVGTIGVTDGSSAPTGLIGELLVADGVIDIAAGTWTDIFSLTLPPGDWDVSGQLTIVTDGLAENFQGGITTAGGGTPSQDVVFAGGSTQYLYGALFTRPINVAVPTPIYLVSYCSVPASAGGSVYARRVR